MKQRLLLALLVLFASVGTTWGQITINAPANSGDIKVQFTAASGGVGEKPTGINIDEKAWTKTSNSVTITIPSTSSIQTYTINRAEGSNYTGVTVTNASKNTGEITINDDVITSFTCSDNGLNNLTVTSAVKLTTLDCSKNNISTSNWNLATSAPNLTTLTCNNNQLTGTINLGAEVTSINCTGNQLTGVTGGKKDTDGSSKLTITAGTQTATYSQSKSTDLPHANEWFDIRTMFEVPSASSSTAKVQLGFYTDINKVKVNSIKKMVNGSKTTANYITNSGVNNNEYKFYSSSNGYEYGSYVLELGTTETGKTGITYEINFLVAPAKFTLTTSKDDGISSVSVNSAAPTKVDKFEYDYSDNTAYQGNLLTVSSTPATNYSFAKYTNLDGLKTDDDATKVTTMEVTGTKSKVATEQIISFKATSTIVQHTLTLVPVAANGSYTVTRKDGVAIENNKVPHGTEIVIEAFPDVDYQVETITVGGAEYTVGGTNAITDNKVNYSVSDNTTIAVTFKKKTSTGVNVTVYAPSFTKVSVAGQNWEQTSSGSSIAFGTSKALSTHTFTVVVNKKGSNPIKVNSITMNNTTKGTVVDNGATFTVAETVTDVTFVVDAVELEEPAFIPTSATQTVKYDGSAKTFAYTTNPVGETFTLRYAKKNGSSYDEAVTTAPTNVGVYKVQYKQKYDNNWLPTDGTYSLTIEKADLTLSLPSISMVTTNGITKYQLSGGSASFNNRSVTGSFVILKEDGSDNNDLIVPDAKIGNSHTVTVKFVPKSAQDQANYNEAKATVTINVSGKPAVETVTIKGTLTNGITVSVFNGSASVNSSSISNGISVAKGSNIRLVFKVPDGKEITDILNDTGTAGSLILSGSSNWADNTLTLENLQDNINFALQVSDVAAKSKFKITVEKDYETTYDGTVKSVESPTTYFTVKKADGNDAAVNSDYTLVYAYKQNGQVVKSPTNAGTYDVEITVQPAGTLVGTYQATTASMKMIVKKATPVINTPPTASVVGKGAKLSSSILTGGSASVPGTFVWAAPETVVEATGKFVVIFKPTDSTNYEEAYGTGNKMAEVKVTDKAVLSISQNENCTIKVTAGTKTYSNGETIPVGTTITITATPAATYKVTKILVNGTAISGTTYTTTAAPINISVEVEQEFTVSVSTTLKGIDLVLPSSNVVKKGASYSFSVKGLAADLANLVVSDGTNIYTGTNGAYTISNITANKTITVTMKAGTAPTQVEAVIEANLSTQGKSMGTVTVTKISSLRADAVDSSTQKFYYGDKIRVTATPAAGCRFVGWEGRTESSSMIDVLITETSYKFKAIFAGSPTGAEVIEGVDIYGSNGEIVVKCDGAARITIVSMNGQSKQQEISGDTRIPAGAGIYGIVFEQGNNVMRTKVAVK